jgi:Ni/Fe-hydrogenase subunit HybB-like protein
MNTTNGTPQMDRSLRLSGQAALIVLTVVGAWALALTLANGHGVLATTQHVPWGLWVAGYIFFLGLSAGSFLLSTLVYVFGVKRLEPAGPLALVQALACLVLGGFLIVMDLGHPERVYKVLTSWNPTSVMAWMGIFYGLYVAIVLVELYLALRTRLIERATSSRLYRWLALGSRRLDEASRVRDRRWLKVLGAVGIPVAVVVRGGVGTIFAVAKARPSWFSGLFPIVFLVSALASGGALLTFVMAATSRLAPDRKAPLVRDLARMSFGILCFDLLLLTSEVLVTFYGNVPHEATGWRLTLFGPYWWVFWFVQLGLGFLVPALLLSLPRTRSSTSALGTAGLLMVLGVAGARLNLVIPAQIQPAFDALPRAYHHVRWAPGYTPNAVEWGVLAGTVALGGWLFLAARRFLPLEETT